MCRDTKLTIGYAMRRFSLISHRIHMIKNSHLTQHTLSELIKMKELQRGALYQGWGQFRFCNSNSNSNSGIFRFYNSNSNSRAYNSNSISRSSIPIPIPIPVTRWKQYVASIHIHSITVRLMVQYGKNTNSIMNKTHREY